jgi:hypothetical protein
MTDHDQETRLEKLLFQARIARDRLLAAKCTPDERAKAARYWVALFRDVYSSRNETAEERAKRLDHLEGLAANVGLSPLAFYLREFKLDYPQTFFTGPAVVKRKVGRPEREFTEAIDIAERVEDLRIDGLTLEKACRAVAEDLGRTGEGEGDAIRKIYEKHKGRLMSPRLAKLRK